MGHKHILGKRGVRHMRAGKKVVHGAGGKVQHKQKEHLQLRNYLLEVHPEFGLYVIGIA